MVNRIKRGDYLSFILIELMVFFNIWFPKAGIKLMGIPLTVGNVLLAVCLIICIFHTGSNYKLKIGKSGLLIILISFFTVIKYLIVYLTTNDIISYIGYIIPLAVYPLIYFVIINGIKTEEQLDKIIRIIVKGFWFLCLYALLQYIVGISNCDIPGLTVNYTDYSESPDAWYMMKSNGTDSSQAKIVSTYQNGNLFGISLLLIYPLVYNFYKKSGHKNKQTISLVLFAVCCLLTLSRTCWLGLALFVLFEIIFKKGTTKQEVAKKIAIIFGVFVCIFLVMNYVPSVANRLLNTELSDWLSMSGRTEGLIQVIKSAYKNGNLLGILMGATGLYKSEGLAYEMFPTSVYIQIGIIGLVLIYSLFLEIIKKLKSNEAIVRGIRLSIIMWLIYGIIECGYWLPPTTCNIFTLAALGYVYNKGENVNEISNNN